MRPRACQFIHSPVALQIATAEAMTNVPPQRHGLPAFRCAIPAQLADGAKLPVVSEEPQSAARPIGRLWNVLWCPGRYHRTYPSADHGQAYRCRRDGIKLTSWPPSCRSAGDRRSGPWPGEYCWDACPSRGPYRAISNRGTGPSGQVSRTADSHRRLMRRW